MGALIQERCLEAQTSIIGSMLIDDGCIGGVLTAVTAEDFTSAPHKTVFGCIKQLFTSGQPVDPVIVNHKLDKAYQDFLAQCLEVTPTAAHAMQYCEILRTDSRLLRLQELGVQLASAGSLDEARKLSGKINSLMVEQSGVRIFTAADLATDFWKRMTSDVKPEYISTGIRALDEKTYIELGDFVGIGGNPSSGKTAFALQWATAIAEKYRVGFYSLETGERKSEDRIFAREAEITLGDIKKRIMPEDAWKRIANACSSVSQLQLEFIPAQHMTAEDVISMAISRRHQIIFIDYLQLVEPSSRRDVRHEQVAEISRTFHTSAQRNGIAVIALSQLGRLEKNKEGKLIKPDMHAFKESSQIEQDLDLAMMIFPAEPNNPNSDRVFRIVKNKEGERGEVEMSFDGKLQKFSPSIKGGYSEIRKMAAKARQEAAQMSMEEEMAALERAGKEFEEVGEDVPF